MAKRKKGTAHKGWTVREAPGGRWRGMVLVPGTGSYRTKAFADQVDAAAWAQQQAAKLVLGHPVESVLATRSALVSDLRKDYEKGLAARGRSASHLRNVARTLDALAAAAPNLLAKSAPTAIEDWLQTATSAATVNLGESRAGLPLSPASRNRMLVEVRAFCRWCMRRGFLPHDPTRAIERSTVPEFLKPQFSLAELTHLLCLPSPDPAWHRRFAVLVYAGLRADEAAALTWADVDTSGRVLLIREHAGFRLKRRRERIVPINPELSALLGPPGRPGDPVAPVGDTGATRGFKRFLRRCGVKDDRSPHSCRHTYAGLMTASGVPGPLLSAYLGHTAAETTMIYTKLAGRYVGAAQGWQRGEPRLVSP